MKFTYLICAFALVFATACNEPTTEKTEVKTETPVEKEKSTEVKVSPNSGSLKTDGIEIEINK